MSSQERSFSPLIISVAFCFSGGKAETESNTEISKIMTVSHLVMCVWVQGMRSRWRNSWQSVLCDIPCQQVSVSVWLSLFFNLATSQQAGSLPGRLWAKEVTERHNCRSCNKQYWFWINTWVILTWRSSLLTSRRTESKGWKSVSPSLELGKVGFSHRYEIKVCFHHPFSQSSWQIGTISFVTEWKIKKTFRWISREEGGQWTEKCKQLMNKWCFRRVANWMILKC